MDISDDVLNVVIDYQKCLQPVEVHRGLQQGNVRLAQSIPLVKHDDSGHPTDEPVTSETWGRFLIAISDTWVHENINQMPIQLFDKTFRQWCGLAAQIERQTMSSMNTRCQTCLLFQYHHGDCPVYCEENGEGVLCVGYQAFSSRAAPHMRVMRDLLKQYHLSIELIATLR